MNHDQPSFSCKQCGACCRWEGHVLLTAQDIAAMASSLQLSEDDFIERYTELAVNRSQLSLKENDEGHCIFLEDNRCIVYDARPEQCRSFPKTWQVSGCSGMEGV